MRRALGLPVAAGRGHRLALLAITGLAAVASSSFGCFVDPINRAPIVTAIERTEQGVPLVQGQDASFTVSAYDPDSDNFTVTWMVQPATTCPIASDRANWPTGTTKPAPLIVDGMQTDARFCVWAFATDRYGAVGAKSLTVDPTDQPPVAAIDLLSPATSAHYPLYTTFELSSLHSFDPDDLENKSFSRSWTLSPPNGSGSTAELVAGDCAMKASNAMEDVRCFTADKPGTYTVELTTTACASGASCDPMSGPYTKKAVTLDVLPDRLPCIGMTAPDSGDPWPGDPATPATFTVVSVDDDGDPLRALAPDQPNPSSQPNQLRFNWYYTDPMTGTLVPRAWDDPSLTISDTYHLGDVSKVRVEIHDRNRDTIDQILRGCGDDDLCPSSPGCFLRVTWNVRWDR